MEISHRATTFVPRVLSGSGSLSNLPNLVRKVAPNAGLLVCLVDEFFVDSTWTDVFGEVSEQRIILPISTTSEPTTKGLDELTLQVRKAISSRGSLDSAVLVGMGGGSVLDTTKALSVLLTNNLNADKLQGWDLATHPGVPKLGVPTLSGTGAEASRTAVLTNSETGLKLGINSDFSVFDAIILDPELTATVPKELYFFNGMDAYMHAFEILEGSFRNPVSDALASAALAKCRLVFRADNPMADVFRLDLMNASLLAGTALTSGYVGAVHPISASIGVGFGLPHGLANVITLMGLSEVYPEHREFVLDASKRLGVSIPPLSSMKSSLSVDELHALSIKHALPLENQLGPNWREELTLEKFALILSRMG